MVTYDNLLTDTSLPLPDAAQLLLALPTADEVGSITEVDAEFRE